MSKTGGGPGSNQYGPKGASRARRPLPRERYGAPGVRQEPATSSLISQFEAKSVVDVVLLDESALDLSGIESRTPERAMHRYITRRADFAFSSAYLEGNSFTLPEVYTLLEVGRTPEGKSTADVDQILALTEASECLLDDIESGDFALSLDQADRMNGILARHEALEPGVRRAYSNTNPDGRGATVNVKGDTFIGLDKSQLREAEPILHERIHAIPHPVLRAVNYAALASYLQVYFDGNKRTARYMMDGELMRHGYDAVAIPAARADEYQESVAQMFRTGDTSPYARFLIDVARRSEPVD